MVTTIANANQNQMFRAIKKFGKTLNKNDVGLFYFAGQGMQVQGNDYLIPIGGNIEDEDELQFSAINAGTVLAKVDTPTGSMLVYATGASAVAADGDGRKGLFTQSLLEHIESPDLSLQGVILRTRAEVVKQSSSKQVPWSSSSMTQSFYFNKSTTTQPQVTMNSEFSMWQLVRNSKSIDELQVFISQFPHSSFTTLAKKRIKLLQEDVVTSSHNHVQDKTYTLGITRFTMKAIPAGSFKMGCVSGKNCRSEEKPVHKVTLKAFSMMETEVTWALYLQCIDSGKCNDNTKEGDEKGWGRGNRPVIDVSFNDINKDFIPWLNKKLNKKTGEGFRLPSEAQ